VSALIASWPPARSWSSLGSGIKYHGILRPELLSPCFLCAAQHSSCLYLCQFVGGSQFKASLGKQFAKLYLKKTHHKKWLVEWLKV
jgi:hypothetical protein